MVICVCFRTIFLWGPLARLSCGKASTYYIILCPQKKLLVLCFLILFLLVSHVILFQSVILLYGMIALVIHQSNTIIFYKVFCLSRLILRSLVSLVHLPNSADSLLPLTISFLLNLLIWFIVILGGHFRLLHILVAAILKNSIVFFFKCCYNKSMTLLLEFSILLKF